jgi:hypothetical protein
VCIDLEPADRTILPVSRNSFPHHVAKYSGKLPETTEQHNNLLHKVLLMSAWLQFAMAISLLAGLIMPEFYWRRRRPTA